MAIAVTIETLVGVPPQAVFDALADLDRWPEWLIASGIIGVARTSSGAAIAGERVTIDQRAAGRTSRVQATVVAADRPVRFAIEGRDADGIALALDAELAPTEDGGTSLRWSVRIDLPLRFRFFESMAGPQVRRAAALDMEAFRRRLVSAPAD